MTPMFCTLSVLDGGMMKREHVLSRLGSCLSDRQVAAILGVGVRLVRKHYMALGGFRLGRKYVFFEKSLINALQNQIWMDGRSGAERVSQAASLQDQTRGFGLGVTDAQADFAETADKHSVLA